MHGSLILSTLIISSVSCSVMSDFATPWTVAGQAPLSMGFSRQEYWSGLPFPLPGNLPRDRTPVMSPALAGEFFSTSPTSASLVAQSCPSLCNPWTVAHQASLSMGFSRQEYWSGLSFPTPGDLLDPRIETASLASLALAGGFFTTSTTWEAHNM